jgi:hypothetical protein
MKRCIDIIKGKSGEAADGKPQDEPPPSRGISLSRNTIIFAANIGYYHSKDKPGIFNW